MVKELDELISTAKQTKSLGFNLLDSFFNKKEYMGEMVEENGTIRITQEVGIGVKPKVDYVGGEIVIKFGNNEKRYSVGCLDKSTLKASLANGVLTIEGRRCGYAGEDKEDTEQGEEE